MLYRDTGPLPLTTEWHIFGGLIYKESEVRLMYVPDWRHVKTYRYTRGLKSESIAEWPYINSELCPSMTLDPVWEEKRGTNLKTVRNIEFHLKFSCLRTLIMSLCICFCIKANSPDFVIHWDIMRKYFLECKSFLNMHFSIISCNGY